MPLAIEKIKVIRRRLGLSQQDAAVKAGMTTRQQWNQVESGRVDNPKLDTIEAVAKALDVKVCELLRD